METRSNHVLVGSVTLALLAGLLVSVSSLCIEYSTLGRGYTLITCCTMLCWLTAREAALSRNLFLAMVCVITAAIGLWTIPVMAYPLVMLVCLLLWDPAIRSRRESTSSNGGSIDEGIARDAWLETVASLDAPAGVDADTLTPDQMRDAFLRFMAHTIEGRLFQDIGARGFKFAADLAAIESFERQLRSYIRRSVRDSFSGDLTAPATLSNQQINVIVDRTYDEAWELMVTFGDAER